MSPSGAPESAATFNVLFRCDGGPTIGMGHVARCLAVAEELGRNHLCRVEFAVAGQPVAVEMVGAAGYHVHHAPRLALAADEATWLEAVLAQCRAQTVVVDGRDGLSLDCLRVFRRSGVSIVLLDDSSERRLAADLAFYPPMPQLERLDWQGFVGKRFVGWPWVALRRQFSGRRRDVAQGPPRVLLNAGGADPAGITFQLVDALELLEGEVEPVLVLGPAFQQSRELRRRLRGARHAYRILSDVKDMAEVMAGSHLAVVSFGMIAYELAAIGVPALYLALSADHAESASAFQEAGMGISLGVHRRVAPAQIAAATRQLLADPERCAAMSISGRALIDGRGAQRIAEQIVSHPRTAYVPVSQVA